MRRCALNGLAGLQQDGSGVPGSIAKPDARSLGHIDVHDEISAADRLLLEVWTEPSRDHAWADHRRILDLIRRDLPDEAVQEAMRHIRNTRDRLIRSLHEVKRGLKARGFAVISR